MIIILNIIQLDCGIRPATSAEAEWLQDYIRKSNNNTGQPANNKSENSGREDGSGEEDDEDSDRPSSGASKRNSLSLSDVKTSPSDFPPELSDKTPTANTLLSQAQATGRPNSGSFHSHAPIRRHTGGQDGGGLGHQAPSPQLTSSAAHPQFMGSQQPISVRHLPHFPSIEEAVGPNSASTHSIAAREVWGWFQDHLDALLESVRSFRFDQFEMHLRTFWSSLTGGHREVAHAPAIAGLMAKADAIVYDVSNLLVVYIALKADQITGNSRDSSLTDAITYSPRFRCQPSSIGCQDGEDLTHSSGGIWQHFRRAESGARGQVRPPRP